MACPRTEYILINSMMLRYPCATALRSAIFINTGRSAKIRIPPMIPLKKVILQNRDASSFTLSIRPSPMAFPRRIAPALARPKQMTVPRFLATITTALAATMSLPRWPMITEYMEKASPQDTSLPKAGREYLIKS